MNDVIFNRLTKEQKHFGYAFAAYMAQKADNADVYAHGVAMENAAKRYSFLYPEFAEQLTLGIQGAAR